MPSYKLYYKLLEILRLAKELALQMDAEKSRAAGEKDYVEVRLLTLCEEAEAMIEKGE